MADLLAVQELGLKLEAGRAGLEREVRGGYASDLLSHVMARAHEGDVWVTVQAHQNIVAVAVLLGLAGIIIAGGIEPQADTLSKAEAEGIPLLTTDLPAFEAAGRLYALGIKAAGGYAQVAQG
ncbi:MAG TPA: serine kinase [Firmicutes bacterium]|jgi:predicted transcriptional regulator|uniref:DRTGG domain-containing protein n=1 Tax=Gelria sp. Kuro-4 TaxID=2796927 RepID=UPI0019B2C527|nr:DRTGG domain-containing protein [Gelria sp. Kuro-4]MDI3522173.1 hypothetical protein [Bacillota bacterium]MDK2927037.1 hypothetical protein [Bacillota bacterium]HHV57423.1 serine kinase [Bacillota bacterium]